MPTIITTPGESLITLTEAKEHLRIGDDNSLDYQISRLIIAATRKVEHDTQRSLMQRTCKKVLDCFPLERYIELEFPPVKSVTSIKYDDTTGAEVTLSASKYNVLLQTTQKARIKLKKEEVWPETDEEPEAVRIEYVAGETDADNIDEDLKQAALLIVSLLFEKNIPVSETQNYVLPMNYEWLIGPHRAW